jgi:hypothetical protein
MAKHVGKHNDRKVVILFREVPDEGHMCLVIYSDLLPRMIHDDLMRAVEGDAGQSAKEIAEVLHRTYMQDGRILLSVLHQEGMIKKVPTSQIIVTPTAQSSVKLDELNKIIREMESGDAAMKRLQELDNATGFVDPAQKRKAEAEFKREQERKSQPQTPYVPPLQTTDGALDDKALASNMLAQAKRMEVEAQGMIAEAARMKKEAEKMVPNVVAAELAPPPEPPRRGRPPKAEKAAAENAVQ